MAGIAKATTAVAKVAKGSTEIQKISRGTSDIWSAVVPDSQLSSTDKAAVDSIVQATITANSLIGVLVSITGPAGNYEKAYGTTGSRPLTTADHFRMASITKTFTGTALWRVIDAGLVSLDDTIEQFVPGIPNGNIITVAQVFSMQSGVFDYTSDSGVLFQILLNPTGAFSQDRALQLIKGGASQFTPGSKYTYNNSNAIVARAIVEAVTGRNFVEILRTDIFTPLGMTQTDWPSAVTIPEPASKASNFNPEIAGAAGALTTTIGDMTKWAKAMRDGTLISSESLDLWHNTFPSTIANSFSTASGTTGPPANFHYGYFQMRAGSWHGHDGGITGFSTAVAFDETTGATIAVAENKGANVAFFRILRNIAAYLYPDSLNEPA